MFAFVNDRPILSYGATKNLTTGPLGLTIAQKTTMATCPDCLRYLGDDHRCKGRWRIRLRLLGWTLRSAVISGVAGGFLLFFVYGRVSWTAIGLTAAIGVIVEKALQWGQP